MTAIAMPSIRESLFENGVDRTKQKVNNIAISTKIFSKNIAYAIKNIPKDAATGLILFGGVSIGDFIYSTLNFQNQKPNSEMNLVIGDKADSTEAAQYDDTYTDLDKKLAKDNTNTDPKVKKTGVDKTAIFKEKRDPKIISIEVGAGDPPLKIGNITINENDLVTSFTDQLGIRDITARFYATTIQKIANSEYYSQYMQVIQIIDGFVKKGKLSTKQGWGLLLYITDDSTFNKMFGPGSKMQKLFKDGLARDKDVKAFYEAGNSKGFIMSGGMFNPTYLGNLLAYSAKMETKSKATASAETDDLGLGDMDFGDEEANAELDAKYDKLLKEYAGNKAKTIEALKEAQSSGIDIWTKYATDIKKSGITVEDLK